MLCFSNITIYLVPDSSPLRCHSERSEESAFSFAVDLAFDSRF